MLQRAWSIAISICISSLCHTQTTPFAQVPQNIHVRPIQHNYPETSTTATCGIHSLKKKLKRKNTRSHKISRTASALIKSIKNVLWGKNACQEEYLRRLMTLSLSTLAASLTKDLISAYSPKHTCHAHQETPPTAPPLNQPVLDELFRERAVRACEQEQLQEQSQLRLRHELSSSKNKEKQKERDQRENGVRAWLRHSVLHAYAYAFASPEAKRQKEWEDAVANNNLTLAEQLLDSPEYAGQLNRPNIYLPVLRANNLHVMNMLIEKLVEKMNAPRVVAINFLVSYLESHNIADGPCLPMVQLLINKSKPIGDVPPDPSLFRYAPRSPLHLFIGYTIGSPDDSEEIKIAKLLIAEKAAIGLGDAEAFMLASTLDLCGNAQDIIFKYLDDGDLPLSLYNVLNQPDIKERHKKRITSQVALYHNAQRTLITNSTMFLGDIVSIIQGYSLRDISIPRGNDADNNQETENEG